MQDWNLMGRYPWDRRTELASHIPEQIAHWLGQTAQEVGIMCLQQNNNNKKIHTHTTQFGKDYSPTFRAMVNRAVSASPSALWNRDHTRWRREKRSSSIFSPNHKPAGLGSRLCSRYLCVGTQELWKELFLFPFPLAFQEKEEQTPSWIMLLLWMLKWKVGSPSSSPWLQSGEVETSNSNYFLWSQKTLTSGISLLLICTTIEENFGKLGASHNRWDVGLGFFTERGMVGFFLFFSS